MDQIYFELGSRRMHVISPLDDRKKTAMLNELKATKALIETSHGDIGMWVLEGLGYLPTAHVGCEVPSGAGTWSIRVSRSGSLSCVARVEIKDYLGETCSRVEAGDADQVSDVLQKALDAWGDAWTDRESGQAWIRQEVEQARERVSDLEGQLEDARADLDRLERRLK